jgi:hypothetical protein
MYSVCIVYVVFIMYVLCIDYVCIMYVFGMLHLLCFLYVFFIYCVSILNLIDVYIYCINFVFFESM